MKKERIKKNIRLVKKLMMTILICAMALSIFACKKKEEKVKYNNIEGVADGKVELSGKEPKINISNIKAQVGADIDFLSGVVVEDEEKFEDLKVWVDASSVDIYEPGDYKAKYTFEYDGKSVEHYITVTIVEGPEESAGDSDQMADAGNTNNGGSSGNNNVGNGNAGNNNGGNANNNPETPVSDIRDEQNEATTKKPDGANQQTTTKKQDNENQQTTTKKQDNANQQTTTKKQDNVSQQTTTKKPASTSSNQATTTKKPATTTSNNDSSETTRRQMITSSGNATTEVKNIGYSYIYLLSGSTVSIKSTTEKYVLLTRTDVSYITKNGVDYKVSKLVIKYNTGEERTLETVEEKCN